MKINKILISPQEYKESLTGIEVAKAMKNGIHDFDKNIKIELAPVADGGDGTLQTMVDVTIDTAVAKLLSMLSAYFITAATTRPPPASSAMTNTTNELYP